MMCGIVTLQVQSTTKELLDVIENEAKIRIDRFVESAIDLAEEVHSGVKREECNCELSTLMITI